MANRETTVRLSVADNFSTQLRAFARALERSDQQATKLSASQKLLQSAGRGATDMLMGMGVALPTSPMLAFGEAIQFSVDAALKQEQANAATTAVLKSTGDVSGYTTDQIVKMADSYSDLSGVSHDVIQSAANVMLTFTAIGHDKFPQAMEAAQNLSAALGTDLQSAVIQVGKALQDPILGLTALRRVGVNFNEAAKDTVKRMMDMGDTAGAQAFILHELNTEFGGMAAALGDTTQGRINKVKERLDRLGESAGNILLPAIDKVTESMSSWLEVMTPATNKEEELRQAVIVTANAFGTNSDQFKTASKMLQDYLIDQQQFDDMLKYSATQNMPQAVVATKKLMSATDDLGKSDQQLAEEQKGLETQLKALTGIMDGQVGPANKKFIDDQVSLVQKSADLKTQIDKLAASDGDLVVSHKKNAISSDELYAANLHLVEVQAEYNRVVANAKPGDIVHADHVAKLRKELDRLKETTGQATDATSKYIDNSKRIQELQGQYDEINKEIKANADEHDKATKRILFDMASQQLAADGLTTTEVVALQKLSAEWGLQDQATSTAVDNVLAATSRLATDKDIPAFEAAMTGAFNTTGKSAGDLIRKVGNLQEKIDSLHDKTVTITIKNQTIGGSAPLAGGAAQGGIMAGQAGFISQGPTLVGEGNYSTFAGKGTEAVIPFDRRGINILAEALKMAIGGASNQYVFNYNGPANPNPARDMGLVRALAGAQ